MAMTLLTTNSGTNQASMSFTSKIDSTYKLYIFKFININPATDEAEFTFQVNDTTDDGGDYDQSYITSTFFRAAHSEDDTTLASLSYDAAFDQAQGQAFQNLSVHLGNGADESTAGTMWLFNPSSTTYVKHFYSIFNAYQYQDQSRNYYCSGYINGTAAVDDIRFKMDSGNFDGTIKMYGVG